MTITSLNRDRPLFLLVAFSCSWSFSCQPLSVLSPTGLGLLPTKAVKVALRLAGRVGDEAEDERAWTVGMPKRMASQWFLAHTRVSIIPFGAMQRRSEQEGRGEPYQHHLCMLLAAPNMYVISSTGAEQHLTMLPGEAATHDAHT